MSQCKKFAPNIFHKTKCTNCFRQKEEHSAEALECNRASRSIARSGYLFVAPDWDFSVPLNRNKRWQRRWFVLYDDGELNYSVDEHPDTVPQGSVDMSKVVEVTGAEQVTGHPHSLALTSPDRVTFVKAASREDARWWAELLAVFPRRHKRNATFPGGRASPSLPQLGRSASPQPPRPRHLSINGPSPRTNFETPPLKEERESPPKDESPVSPISPSQWMPQRTNNVQIEGVASPIRTNYMVSSGSPPTRDKLRCDDKARARRDWRNERLRDIATALTDRSPESSLALPAEGLLHLKKGWLWLKQGDLEWLRRWIVLCGPTLNIYAGQNEQQPPELVVELSTVTNYNEIPTDSKYAFEIHWSGQTLVLSAISPSIRTNWLQALKKAAPIVVDSPMTPSTPRSLLLSSDEEYRTASEGGRRGSEDWSELPPSPPLSRLNLHRTKSRSRIGPKLPRSQSRQSTLDSVSTDELDCGRVGPDLVGKATQAEVEELQKQLAKTLSEVEVLQEEIARLKKLQSDAALREEKTAALLLNYERTEHELNQRNSQNEAKLIKEQRSFQRRLAESDELYRTCEEKCAIFSRELQSKQRLIATLQADLESLSERSEHLSSENSRLHTKLRKLEHLRPTISCDSLTDLTNINLDLDIDELNSNELQEYCLDLKTRFETAICEIRALKRELRNANLLCTDLELSKQDLDDRMALQARERSSELALLVARLDDLTTKLNSAEKQLKFKAKTEARDKRRSLSLKGRESFSINKEVEDKVTELEAKILALERGKTRRKYKRDRSSERSSPIDDKSLRRLRRKSLDSATNSEPMKILMRLTTLESKVTNVSASNESLATTLLEDEQTNKIIGTAQLKLNELLAGLSRLAPEALESQLIELNDILAGQTNNTEFEVVYSSANAVVKQLQSLLVDKLTSLAERRRLLVENGRLDAAARLEILAEKIAYENILVCRIQEALLGAGNRGDNSEDFCSRLIGKEVRETASLMADLHGKLSGTAPMDVQPPKSKTGVEYLSKILAKCLTTAAQGFKYCKNFTESQNSQAMAELLEKQRHLQILFASYKTNKLPLLAESLAHETLQMSADKTCRLRTITDDFTRRTADSVNTELIQSEINHILVRAAQVYQSNLNEDHSYFFSFFAAERAGLELFADSVAERLVAETAEQINELKELYQASVGRLQRIGWRRRSRDDCSANVRLNEFADLVAHKALIDARVEVLAGRKPSLYEGEAASSDCLTSWLENERSWSSVEMNQSLEAEFACMLDRFSGECFTILGQPELDEVLGYLDEVFDKVDELTRCVNVHAQRDCVVNTWSDVCQKCRCLKENLEAIRVELQARSCSPLAQIQVDDNTRPVYLGTEYLTQVENLRASYRCALASCKERHQESDIEHLQSLCERVLSSMEQWHRKTIQDLREAHAKEMDGLRQDKEQALAEETQATLAALDAMRKAHEAEVQKEVARFKQEFARQQRNEILDLSDRLSAKSMEAAALEEQLGSATRQLAHAQQHLLQLERNPQLSTMQN